MEWRLIHNHGGFYIPDGYTQVSGTTFETGLVIQDNSGNEFVWVEVPKNSTTYPTAGLNITEFTDTDYTKIENDLHTYTSIFREEGFSDTWSSKEATGLTENQYNTQKKNMLKSIYKNGGFYVGRYETGIEGSYRQFDNQEYVEHPTTETPVIKANAYPYNWVRSGQAQNLASSFGTDGYTSSLMFGVQWDLVLKYMQTKGASVDELDTNSKGWGNYYSSTSYTTSAQSKYSTDFGATWTSGTYNKIADISALLTTGASSKFNKFGIYDLAGNVNEWTLEQNVADSSNPIVYRGGNYTTYSGETASWHWGGASDYSHSAFGFRVALYKDEDAVAPYIPEGFSYVEGNLNTGYVVEDSSGNQFVWVEVPKNSTTYPTAGLNITEFTDTDYTKIENDLHTYTSVYRNGPGGVGWKDEYSGDDTSTGLTESEYNTQKKKMLKSIYTYGGFYVGRYEAGTTTLRTSASATLTTPIIKKDAYPYNYVTTSQAQELSESFATTGYEASLMFGVQWDLILKHFETKGVATQAELTSDSTNWGNCNNNLWSVTSTTAKYSTNNGSTYTATPYTKTASANVLLTTGANNSFSKMGIYDIAGNVWERTLEHAMHSSSLPCAVHGGNYFNSGNSTPASYRHHTAITSSGSAENFSNVGFRPSLYKEVEYEQVGVSPSEIFDADGTDAEGLHIGDFVNYDAGTWTQEEINAIQTGYVGNLAIANGSSNLPWSSYQFGGFVAGSSRNGNASSPSYSTDGYVKEKSTGDAITGWRVFDIEGDNVTLISAGHPEDYYHDSEAGMAYQDEYILSGNVNSGWSAGNTSDYQKRDWSNYVNSAQKAVSATSLTKSALDSWYSKYIQVNANVSDDTTFQMIYDDAVEYQSLVDIGEHYWLGTSFGTDSLYTFEPNSRWIAGGSRS